MKYHMSQEFGSYSLFIPVQNKFLLNIYNKFKCFKYLGKRNGSYKLSKFNFINVLHISLHSKSNANNLNLTKFLLWLNVNSKTLEHRAIGLMSRVFANDLGNRGSILGQVIPKTQKWYLMPLCLALNTIRWESRVKWRNPENGVARSPSSRCSSYWKGSLWVVLD